MRSIVGWSLKARFIVLALAVGMMVFGAREVQKAPMDVFPEFAPPRVEIQTLAIGLSAVEVEQLVTVPLEEQLNGVDDLKTIRSKSVRDLSQIEMIFERGTDLLVARQQVSERLVAITPTLPTWASPPFLMQPLSATSRAMKIGLETTDPEITQEELSMISYWNIKPRLLAVNGVANVQIYGEQIDMFQVQMDPALMKEHGVTIDAIMETTADSLDSGLLQYSNGGFIGTGGFVETPNQRLSVRHISPILGPEDLTDLPIKGYEHLTLGDVTQLVRGHQPLIGDAVVNDGRGIMLIVEKLPWANNVDISKGVEEAMKDLEPGLEGIAVDTTVFRPATFIEASIDNLTEAMIIASVLVILILVLFLFEWRTALISVVAIPLSLMAAGLVLLYMDTTINVMVLAGMVIAIGVVVDDAIIDVENIWRRLREARSTGDHALNVAYCSGRVAGSSQLHHPRDSFGRSCPPPRIHARGPCRRLLQAPGLLLHSGGHGVVGGGANSDPGDGLAPTPQCKVGKTRADIPTHAPQSLPVDTHPDCEAPKHCLSVGRRRRACRPRDCSRVWF